MKRPIFRKPRGQSRGPTSMSQTVEHSSEQEMQLHEQKYYQSPNLMEEETDVVHSMEFRIHVRQLPV